MSTILAAGMLAAGIGLGALIGPGPASSLASGTRAAAIARVVALLALDDGANASGSLLASSAATHPPASTPTPTPSSGGASNAASSATGGGNSGAGNGSGGGQSETSSSTGKPAPSSAVSPTKGKPAAGSGESQPVRLPPIGHVWLIVLPSGQSFTNVLGQPSAAPYLTGQLISQGTLLSGYSSLAADELASSATLLSGQEAAAVSTIAPPCVAAASAQGAAGGTTSTTGSTTSTAGAPPSTAGAGTTTGTSSGTPCATAEPAGAQAADTFLHEVVAQIVASASYRESGLIAITFAAPSEGTSTTSPATPAISYPAGTVSSTLTATGTPGALLLSPFLRRPGARLSSAFDALAPRKNLEELLKTKTGS